MIITGKSITSLSVQYLTLKIPFHLAGKALLNKSTIDCSTGGALKVPTQSLQL